MELVAFGVTALLGGLVQGVTGFGSGIVMMLVLPFLLSIPQSAAVSSLSAIPLAGSMVWRYRKSVSPRKVLLPAIPYLICSGSAIFLSTLVDQDLLKRVFGGFLVALAVYNFATMGRTGTGRLSLPVKVVCVVVSGLCDGLFGIGGPLMVMYFLSETDSHAEYLGSTQLFFFCNLVANSVLRAARGILTVDLLPMAALGVACLLVGLAVANRVLLRLNRAFVLRLTYAVIALCGVTNLL